MRFIDRQKAEVGTTRHQAPEGASGVREPGGVPGPDGTAWGRSRSVGNQAARAVISRDGRGYRHDRTRIVVGPVRMAPRRGSLLVLLLALLAAAEIGASPSAAEVCGQLPEIPCGP